MAAVDVASLLVAETEESLTAAQLGILQSEGFEVTNWGDFDPNRVQIAADVRTLKALADLIPLITKGGFLAESYGNWLTLLASSNYAEARQLATNTQRWLRASDSSGSPTSFEPGDIVVSSVTGLIYRSIAYSTDAGVTKATTGALPANGQLDVLVQAESPGSAYNGATPSWSLISSFPGITLADAPMGVLALGLDEQQDGPLQRACTAKWGTLGAGANDDAWYYLATHTPSVGAAVSRATVYRHTPLPGQVTIVVAGPTSAGPDAAPALDSTSVSKIQGYLDPPSHKGRAPNCTEAFVNAAVFKKISVVGTVTGIKTELDGAQAAAVSALNAWAASAPIGGRIAYQKIIAKILAGLSDDPKNDAAITSPAADVILTSGQVPYFDLTGLTWTPAT